jgi:hypothetical protein
MPKMSGHYFSSISSNPSADFVVSCPRVPGRGDRKSGPSRFPVREKSAADPLPVKNGANALKQVTRGSNRQSHRSLSTTQNKHVCAGSANIFGEKKL